MRRWPGPWPLSSSSRQMSDAVRKNWSSFGEIPAAAQIYGQYDSSIVKDGDVALHRIQLVK